MRLVTHAGQLTRRAVAAVSSRAAAHRCAVDDHSNQATVARIVHRPASAQPSNAGAPPSPVIIHTEMAISATALARTGLIRLARLFGAVVNREGLVRVALTLVLPQSTQGEGPIYIQAVRDGPGRDRTCDLGIKSPARMTAASGASLKLPATSRTHHCDGLKRIAACGDVPVRAGVLALVAYPVNHGRPELSCGFAANAVPSRTFRVGDVIPGAYGLFEVDGRGFPLEPSRCSSPIRRARWQSDDQRQSCRHDSRAARSARGCPWS